MFIRGHSVPPTLHQVPSRRRITFRTDVIVEPTQDRVRFLLYDVNGRLRWRDIRTGGSVKPVVLLK